MNEAPEHRDDENSETPADPDAAARQAEGINPADGPGPYGNPEVDRDKLEKVEDEIDSTGPN